MQFNQVMKNVISHLKQKKSNEIDDLVFTGKIIKNTLKGKKMLEIEQSKIGRYKILNLGEKKYLLDIDFTNPIAMLFESPANHKLSGVLIDEKIYQEVKGKVKGSIGILPIVLITQPFIGIVYNLGQSFLSTINENSILIFKIINIFFTISVSVIGKLIISWNDKRIANNYISDKRIFEIVVYDEQKKYQRNKTFLTDSWLIILLTAVVPLILYFKLNDGKEIAFYFIFSIAFFLFLIMSRYPLQSSIYKSYNVKIKE